MDSKLTYSFCSHKTVCSPQNPNVTAVTSTCNIRWETAVPDGACNTDGTKTDCRRRRAAKHYRKQWELKFTFRTEQQNSSRLTALEKQWVQFNWVGIRRKWMTITFIQLMDMKYIPYSSAKELELLRLHVNLLHVPYHQTILNLKQPTQYVINQCQLFFTETSNLCHSKLKTCPECLWINQISQQEY
jgi:hypothetical protein